MGEIRRAAANVETWTDVLVRAGKVAVYVFLSAPIVNAFLEGQAADFNALIALARAAVAAGISVVVNAVLLRVQPD